MNLKLDTRTLRTVLIGAVGVSVILFVVIAVLGLSKLSGKSKTMVNLKLQSQTANDQLSSLESSKKQVEKYSYFKSLAQTVIPSDKDQAEAVLAINQMANESGIAIQSITFPASNLGASSGTATDATSSSSAKTAITQAKPVSGVSGLYSLELTITPESGNSVPADKQITYDKMLKFLNLIENNRRTAQITQVNIQPGTSNQSFTFSLIINIFIKPS